MHGAAVTYSIDQPTTNHNTTRAYVVRGALECLHLLPQLRELSVSQSYGLRLNFDPPIVILPLPSSLTYLHLVGISKVLVAQHAADTQPVELQAALPSSLLCLSLVLPSEALTISMLLSLPLQCPQLTHCHIGYLLDAGGDKNDYFSEDNEDSDRNIEQLRKVEWARRLQVLKRHLDAGCRSVV